MDGIEFFVSDLGFWVRDLRQDENGNTRRMPWYVEVNGNKGAL